MEQPSLAYCVHLSRLLHMPVTEVLKLDVNEMIYQQAFDVMNSKEFQDKYELERQNNLSDDEHNKMLEDMFK